MHLPVAEMTTTNDWTKKLRLHLDAQYLTEGVSFCQGLGLVWMLAPALHYRL
jgi:hypothetical protein